MQGVYIYILNQIYGWFILKRVGTLLAKKITRINQM